MLPRGTALIVTSDHGMVDVGDSVIEINDSVMQRTNTISGEAVSCGFTLLVAIMKVCSEIYKICMAIVLGYEPKTRY